MIPTAEAFGVPLGLMSKNQIEKAIDIPDATIRQDFLEDIEDAVMKPHVEANTVIRNGNFAAFASVFNEGYFYIWWGVWLMKF